MSKAMRLTSEEVEALQAGETTIEKLHQKRKDKKDESNAKREKYIATRKERKAVCEEKNIVYVPIGSAVKSNESLSQNSIVDRTIKKICKYEFFAGTGYYLWDGIWAYVQGKLNSKKQNAYPVVLDDDGVIETALVEAVASYEDYLVNGKPEEIEEVNGFSFHQ